MDEYVFPQVFQYAVKIGNPGSWFCVSWVGTDKISVCVVFHVLALMLFKKAKQFCICNEEWNALLGFLWFLSVELVHEEDGVLFDLWWLWSSLRVCRAPPGWEWVPSPLEAPAFMSVRHRRCFLSFVAWVMTEQSTYLLYAVYICLVQTFYFRKWYFCYKVGSLSVIKWSRKKLRKCGCFTWQMFGNLVSITVYHLPMNFWGSCAVTKAESVLNYWLPSKT